MGPEMNLDELLAEYKRLGVLNASDDEGLTTNELAEKWRVPHSTAKKMLRRFHNAGWLRVGRKTVTRFDGVQTRVSCYRIEVPKEQAKQSKRRK